MLFADIFLINDVCFISFCNIYTKIHRIYIYNILYTTCKIMKNII